MTGNTGMDTLLILIMVAATIWYIDSIKDDLHKLVYKFKKKTYRLCIYHEGTQKFKTITTYRERSMRNAMTEHFLSYERDLALLYYRTYTDYNDIAMYYTLTIDGDTYHFTMMQEVDGLEDEQG